MTTMTTMTLFDLKALEQQRVAERADRLGWLVESVAGANRAKAGERGWAASSLARAGVALVLVLVLALLALGSVTVA